MASSCGIIRQSVYLMRPNGEKSRVPPLSSPSVIQIHHHTYSSPLIRDHIHLTAVKLKVPRATGSSVSPSNDDGGVSLGTMKLPLNTDLQRFDSLLFQWANSLCQGANLPLDMPLKVDKIPGGARLGFVTIGDGQTEVLVYIDCVVFPPTDSSTPIFRAIRKGPLKDKVLPGEPRIMRSLMQALQKSVQIARL